ncbi:MAG: thiamine phosphate synthase [Clostridia bacterium]|nr:thiamine phosphate synthase [Clostridia bacterium]
MRISADELRLYAVTDRSWLGGETIFDQVEKAVRGGASCVQLREKELGHEDFLAEAKEMAKLCRRLGVKLIINDNVDVALESGADGVHVGQDDMQAMDVRRRIGPDRILGVTAKTVEQARAAEAAGADYLGSGAVFGSATKTDAKPMTMDTLRSICASVGIPVVGIGGVNRENIARLAGSGVAGAAVVSGIFAARDIEAECRLLRGMVEEIIR